MGYYQTRCSCKITEIVVDTAHFRGNFPQKVNVKGINVDEESKIEANSDAWEVVVDDSKTSADKEHAFKVKDNSKVYSHIKLTIIPDGGVKRIRAFGVKA